MLHARSVTRTLDPRRVVRLELSMHFEWDPTKARKNLRKHGVSFEEALQRVLRPSGSYGC